jgi:outer membrane lipoprotein SlyB
VLFRSPATGFLLVLLQLCLRIPSSLENAAGLHDRGVAVLGFPGVVVGSGGGSGCSIVAAVVFIHGGISLDAVKAQMQKRRAG